MTKSRRPPLLLLRQPFAEPAGTFWSVHPSPEFANRALIALAGAALLWAVLAASHAPFILAALVVCSILLEAVSGDLLRLGGRAAGPSLAFVTAAYALLGTPAAVLVGFARGAARLLSARSLGRADSAATLAGAVFGPLIGGVAASLVVAFQFGSLAGGVTYVVIAYLVEIVLPAAVLRATGPPSLALAGYGDMRWTSLMYLALAALGFLLARDLGAGHWTTLFYVMVPIIAVRFAYSALRARSERYLAALERENIDFFDRIGKLDRINGDLIEALAFAIDYRDGYDSGQSRRVASLSASMGSVLGLESTDIEQLRRGALLHDVGLLAMPGRRTPRHIELGARLVARWKDYRQIADIVEQYCEMLDGSGYPRGLRGNEICLPARVVGVATRYIELISPRPDGGGLSHETALADIRSYAPEKYDPHVVEALAAAVAPASADVLPLVRRI